MGKIFKKIYDIFESEDITEQEYNIILEHVKSRIEGFKDIERRKLVNEILEYLLSDTVYSYMCDYNEYFRKLKGDNFFITNDVLKKELKNWVCKETNFSVEGDWDYKVKCSLHFNNKENDNDYEFVIKQKYTTYRDYADHEDIRFESVKSKVYVDFKKLKDPYDELQEILKFDEKTYDDFNVFLSLIFVFFKVNNSWDNDIDLIDWNESF